MTNELLENIRRDVSEGVKKGYRMGISELSKELNCDASPYDIGLKIGLKMSKIETGKEAAYVSQREAYRRYGEASVKRWIEEGVVKRIPTGDADNSKYRLSILELEIASQSETIFRQ